MSIKAISSNLSFTSNNSAKTISSEQTKETTQLDKKKLLIGGLVGLGCIAAAGIAIAKCKKVPSELSIDEFKKIGQFDHGTAKAKGKLFSGTIVVPKDNGKISITYKDGNLVESIKYKKFGMPEPLNEGFSSVWKKVYSSKDDTKTVEKYTYNILSPKDDKFNLLSKTEFAKDKITTVKNILGTQTTSKVVKQADGTILSTKEIIEYPAENLPLSAYRRKTINTKTGEVLDTKLERFPKAKQEKGGLLRKTQDGVTTKNGKIFATRTEKIDEKGNKIITVDYGNRCKKIITITPQGEKIESGSYKDFLDL